jgi:molecular chaperone DnaJ
MNTNQACELLGVPIGAAMDDVKKAFKKKAAEYHPDRNKAEDAEAKFKEVNEAYQLLEKHGTSPQDFGDVSSGMYSHGDHLADELRRRMSEIFGANGFSPFGSPRQVRGEPIIIPVDVPFEMAVLGGKKDVTFERNIKCETCTGGKVAGGNKQMCQKCGGHGKRKYGQDDKELPCTSCNATGYTSNESQCSDCSGTGIRKIVDTLRVNIPPGVESGLRLILKGKGHFRLGGYDNVVVVIRVLPDHDMQLSGVDVISVVELSLLEALQGTKKKLRTVKGDKTLVFKPKSRHRDTVRVSGFGVPPYGAHTFVINVTYPDNVDDLIEVLEKRNDPEPEEISGEQS